MALERKWTVHPGENGEIDGEELYKSLLDIGALLRRTGGAVLIAAVRAPDEDIPGEMFTSHVVCQWLSRTDTQPKAEVPPAPAPAAAEDVVEA